MIALAAPDGLGLGGACLLNGATRLDRSESQRTGARTGARGAATGRDSMQGASIFE